MIKERKIYLNTLALNNEFKCYKSIKSKITYMVKTKKLIRVKRGLYLRNNDFSYSIKTLANKIYGPSYISFEYALAFYGMIPERVEIVTSASYKKNKNKRFETLVGIFTYNHIPETTYYYGVRILKEGDNPFFIASREKALCDTIYKLGINIKNENMREILEENLRIDNTIIKKLNIKELSIITIAYNKKIIYELFKIIKEIKYE